MLGLRSLLFPTLLVTAAIAGACGGDGTGNGGNGNGGHGAGGGKVERSGTRVSTTILLTADDEALWVVNPDADSVSVIDPDARKLIAEIPLGSKSPEVDPETKRYDPAVTPRALALVNGTKVYVAGKEANRVYVIDTDTRKVTKSIPVPAAPSGIAAAPDGSAVYVVSHEAGVLTRIDTSTDTPSGDAALAEHPWSVTVSADGARLFVTHLLRGAGVSVLDAQKLTVTSTTVFADEPYAGDKRIPSGMPRGLYQAAPHPKTGELWVPHNLHNPTTAQPELDFESTVFPTISVLSADGAASRRLLFKAPVAGAKGSFSDSVSGPRAIDFTPDGKLALLALMGSEDVMVFDAASGNEIGLVRPVPSAMIEGIAVDHAGKRAFVDGRNTHDVSVLALDSSNTIAPATVDGTPIERLTKDPMPAELRHGQRLFFTANSAAFPITKNFWVSCSSCHIEGGIDAITWRFGSGPRNTPSNAGGPVNTGFIMRLATRNELQQYDETIRVEQGGSYDMDDPSHQKDLDALAAYTNYAIPFPQNPHRAADGKLTDAQERGKVIFDKACASCHSGTYFTDSGKNNPTLDLDGTVTLHDVGTCVKSGPHKDKPVTDVLGNPRDACSFDTPTLRGIFATAPYFHDGSAATLRDVVDRHAEPNTLSDEEKDDLVAYQLSL